jgi:hypothetical protein
VLGSETRKNVTTKSKPKTNKEKKIPASQYEGTKSVLSE